MDFGIAEEIAEETAEETLEAERSEIDTGMEDKMEDALLDLDPAGMGIALGFGEEMSQGDIEQREAEKDCENIEEKGDGEKEESVMLTHRNKERSRYYDPFLHYALEVSMGEREIGDTSGINFKSIDDGPDENGNY